MQFLFFFFKQNTFIHEILISYYSSNSLIIDAHRRYNLDVLRIIYLLMIYNDYKIQARKQSKHLLFLRLIAVDSLFYIHCSKIDRNALHTLADVPMRLNLLKVWLDPRRRRAEIRWSNLN